MADDPKLRRGLMAGASFFGIGRGFGRPAAADPVVDPNAPPGEPPADTEGDPPPAPGTPRQQLRGKVQKVLDDDAADDPNEMTGNDDVAQARVREQARCAAIMGCAAAQDRVDYAAHLAFNTRHTRQDAVALLVAAPAEAKGGVLGRAMAGHQHQRPGPDAPPAPVNKQAALDAGWDDVVKAASGGNAARRH